MKPIRRSYSYYLRGSRLYLQILWEGSRKMRISTGCNVDPEGWEGSRCRPNSRHGKYAVPATVINSELNDLERKLEELFISHELKETIPLTEEIKLAVNPEKPALALEFATQFDAFIREESRRRMWAPNTVKSVRQVGALVEAFAPRLRLGSINARWLDRWTAWQQSHRLKPATTTRRAHEEQEETPEGYSNSVIAKHCRVLRWFLRWAVEKGMLNLSDVAGWRPTIKQIAKPVIFCTWEEVMRIARLELAEGSPVDRARDIFCFQCFTGLRYSDAMALRRADVKPGHIEVTTQKTGSLLRIELNTHSRRILEKYARAPGTRALPWMDASQMNLHLKTVGQLADISEPVTVTQYYGSTRRSVTSPKYELLSSHAGRRSFICNALALGIPLTVVMKWTGHTEVAAMKPYIDVADVTKARAMELFDSLD